MKIIWKYSYDLHLCYQTEGGNEVIQFQINLKWELPECRRGVMDGEEMLLHMESFICRDEDGLDCIGFQIKFSPNGKMVKFGTGKKAYRFPWKSTHSGGNIFWEVITFRNRSEQFVFNWLRRQKQFSKSEWVTEFFETIWSKRGSLTKKDLKNFAWKSVRNYLRHEAKQCNCTVEELLKLSSHSFDEIAKPEVPA